MMSSLGHTAEMSVIDDGSDIIEDVFHNCNDVIPLKVERKNQIDVMWIGRKPVVVLARLEDSLLGRPRPKHVEPQSLNNPLERQLEKNVKSTLDQTVEKTVGRPSKIFVQSPFITTEDHLLQPVGLPLKKRPGRPLERFIIETPLKPAIGHPSEPVELPLKKRVGRPLKRAVGSLLISAKDRLLKPVGLPRKKYVGQPLERPVVESTLKVAVENGSLEHVELPLKKRRGRPPLKRTVESPLITAKNRPLKPARLPLKKSVGRPLKRPVVESTLKMAEDHSLEYVALPLKKLRGRPLKKRLGRLLKRPIESPLRPTEDRPLKPIGLMLKKQTGLPLKGRLESSSKTGTEHPLEPVGLPLKKCVGRPLKRPRSIVQPQPTKEKVPDSINQNVFKWPCCKKRVHTSTYYCECSVPLCTNNTSTSYGKHFTRVSENQRKTDASSDVFDTSHLESNMQFCEDHFNLQEDVEDDGNGYIKMLDGNFCLKPNVVPHIFKCWTSSKPRPTTDSRPMCTDDAFTPSTIRRASTRAKDITSRAAITPTGTMDMISSGNMCTKSTKSHFSTNPTCTLTRSASLDAMAAGSSHCAIKSGPSTIRNSRRQSNVILPSSRLPISVKLKLHPDYQPGDVCYAKIRGYRAWPAQIDIKLGESLNDVRYRVVFFGTSETAVCKASDIFMYNEANTLKFNVGGRNQGAYKRAMLDLEEYVHVNGARSTPSKEPRHPVQIETYSEEILQCALDTDKYSDQVVVEAINDKFVNYSFPMGQEDPLEDTSIRWESNRLPRSDAVQLETPDQVGTSVIYCGQRDMFSGISSVAKSVALKEVATKDDPRYTFSKQNETFTGKSKRKNVLKMEMTRAEHMWKVDEVSDQVYCSSECSDDPLSPSDAQSYVTEHIKQELTKDVNKHEDLKQIECVDLESSDEERSDIETHRTKIINTSYDKFLSPFYP